MIPRKTGVSKDQAVLDLCEEDQKFASMLATAMTIESKLIKSVYGLNDQHSDHCPILKELERAFELANRIMIDIRVNDSMDGFLVVSISFFKKSNRPYFFKAYYRAYPTHLSYQGYAL
ncbi:MAG: hypothetical protein MRY49_01225 [Candidatus Pacebacteria bacterium]|nr:hypothetical protein [Candidatus Paceibacterota bacterium]